MRIDDLKPFLDHTVILRMTNGEFAKVKVTFVDEDDGEIFAAIVDTSNPETFRQACAVYTFAAADIASIELSD